ncbi:ketoacyl-ACP synthase III family protein [Kitasatospora sp. NPDC052896]|uniref:ketoacyl-ACP synthase III family protein n=1 Tax=Kitasatospora sp. NPDC052896 TaxID=3364061 RepID=UPI0037C996C3
MRWDDIYLQASASRLGRAEDVQEAVAQGRYDPEECAEDGYLSVSVIDDESPADLAVSAARSALRRSGVADRAVDLVIHSSVGFQGIDHWSPAAYIQRHTVAGQAAAVEIKQASNGGLAALDLAAAYLAARPAPAAALLTTADVYQPPVFDRYCSDQGWVRGDGATALVLGREPGLARLLATCLVGDSTHEEAHRCGEPWAKAPGERGWPVDLRSRRREYFLGGHEPAEIGEAIVGGIRQVMRTGLKDAGVDVSDIARFVFPHAARHVARWAFAMDEFGIPDDRTTLDWGMTVGHIGAGDQIAGLTHLLETRQVAPGDLVLLTGLGAGLTFASAVLEIREQPDWAEEQS